MQGIDAVLAMRPPLKPASRGSNANNWERRGANTIGFEVVVP